MLIGQNQEILGELDHCVVVNEHMREALDRKGQVNQLKQSQSSTVRRSRSRVESKRHSRSNSRSCCNNSILTT